MVCMHMLSVIYLILRALNQAEYTLKSTILIYHRDYIVSDSYPRMSNVAVDVRYFVNKVSNLAQVTLSGCHVQGRQLRKRKKYIKYCNLHSTL